MAKPVTLKIGQYLLLVVSLLAIGAAVGMTTVAIYWRIHAVMLLSIPVEMVGIAAFAALSVWRTMEARKPGTPLYS